MDEIKPVRRKIISARIKRAEEDSDRKLVSEVLRDADRQSKRLFIAFLITLASLVGTNLYWIYQWNSYDYVSQDGEGYNYYNADVEGDIVNGAADSQKEE